MPDLMRKGHGTYVHLSCQHESAICVATRKKCKAGNELTASTIGIINFVYYVYIVVIIAVPTNCSDYAVGQCPRGGSRPNPIGKVTGNGRPIRPYNSAGSIAIRITGCQGKIDLDIAGSAWSGCSGISPRIYFIQEVN